MTTTDTGFTGFTKEERSAMKERARELKAEAKASKAKASADQDVRAKIAKMREGDRVLAERLHELVGENAPSLTPKLWYGMPAYTRDGKIVCHFQPAEKFKTRYATFTFSDEARLDDGSMWPVSFAVPELTDADAAALAERLRRAAA